MQAMKQTDSAFLQVLYHGFQELPREAKLTIELGEHIGTVLDGQMTVSHRQTPPVDKPKYVEAAGAFVGLGTIVERRSNSAVGVVVKVDDRPATELPYRVVWNGDVADVSWFGPDELARGLVAIRDPGRGSAVAGEPYPMLWWPRVDDPDEKRVTDPSDIAALRVSVEIDAGPAAAQTCTYGFEAKRLLSSNKGAKFRLEPTSRGFTPKTEQTSEWRSDYLLKISAQDALEYLSSLGYKEGSLMERLRAFTETAEKVIKENKDGYFAAENDRVVACRERDDQGTQRSVLHEAMRAAGWSGVGEPLAWASEHAKLHGEYAQRLANINLALNLPAGDAYATALRRIKRLMSAAQTVHDPKLWADDVAAKTCRSGLLAFLGNALDLGTNRRTALADLLESDDARRLFALLIEAPEEP